MKIIKKGNVYKRCSKFQEYEYEIYTALVAIEAVLIIILAIAIRR